MPPNTNQVRFTNVFKFLCNILSGCRDTHEELKNKTFWKLDIRLKYTRTWKFFVKLWKSQNTQHTHQLRRIRSEKSVDGRRCYTMRRLKAERGRSVDGLKHRTHLDPIRSGVRTRARSIRLCEEITRLIRKNKLVSEDSCRVLGMRKKIYIVK